MTIPRGPYWAYPQSPSGSWHVVVANIDRPGRFSLQATACHRRIMQQEEWHDGAGRAYLRHYACQRCLDLHPIPDEGVTLDGEPWPRWETQGTPSPMFPGASRGPQVFAE